MATGTVTISGVSYDIYGTQAAAKDYLRAKLGNDAFIDASSSNQKKALVSATRWIDREVWQGTKTSSSQPLDFPRTGLICEGVTVDSADPPVRVEEAMYELASILIGDSLASANANTSDNTKKLQAGSASIEFFRPGDAQGGSGTLFPTEANKLLSCFLGGAGSSIKATGLSDDSHFTGCDDYGLSEGYK